MYHKWQSCAVWFLRYGIRWPEIFGKLDYFLPYYPTNKPKNQSFEKMKKTSGDIIILHKCTKNYDHMITVPEMRCVTDIIFIFHFGLFFALLRLYQPIKSKFKKNEKKELELSSFYTSVPKIMITWWPVPEIWCVTVGRTDRWTGG